MSLEVDGLPIFCETTILISKRDVQVCIPSNSGSCSTASPARAMTCVFDLSHSDRCKMESQSCLICISLVAKDVKHFFVSQPFVITSLRIVCIDIFVPYFLIGLFSLLIPSFLSSLYISDISLLSHEELVKIFSFSVICLFVPLLLSFALQKLFGFMRSHLLMAGLSAYPIGVLLKSCLLCQCAQAYSPLSLLAGLVYLVLC